MTSTPPGAMVPRPSSDAIAVSRTGPSTENPVAVYLARLAEGSRPTMMDALERVADMLGVQASVPKPRAEEGDRIWRCAWARVDYDTLRAISARLVQREHYRTNEPIASTTVNRHLAAVRGVMLEAFKLRQIDGEHYARVRSVESIKGTRLPAGRALSSAEIQALTRACDGDTPLGARNRALVALLYQAGLRCGSDAARLNLSAWNPGDGTLRITGKGNKQRFAHIDGTARKALDRWLAFRGDAPGPLFLTIAPRGGVSSKRKRLSSHGMRQTLKRLAVVAEVQRFSPHDMRRSFISDLLDRDADIVDVSLLAGHASVETTRRYDRRPERRLRKVASMLADVEL